MRTEQIQENWKFSLTVAGRFLLLELPKFGLGLKDRFEAFFDRLDAILNCSDDMQTRSKTQIEA